MIVARDGAGLERVDEAPAATPGGESRDHEREEHDTEHRGDDDRRILGERRNHGADEDPPAEQRPEDETED